MRIRTTLLAGNADGDSADDTAVVIDVLRATSVIATALAAGAERVITCREIEEAKQIARGLHAEPLLCGERGCLPIPGFDLGNSPAEYTSARVGSKTLVLTTTNGTAAIETAISARHVFTTSFLNLSATVSALQAAESVHLICAGTDRRPADEDISLAGALVERCVLEYEANIDDASRTALALWRRWKRESAELDSDALMKHLRETRGGQNLIRAGLEADIASCAQIDQLDVAPELLETAPPTLRDSSSV